MGATGLRGGAVGSVLQQLAIQPAAITLPNAMSALLTQLRRLHDALREIDQVYMVLVALVIGLLGGLAAVGFRLLIRLGEEVAWQQGDYSLAYLSGLPFWWKILTPAAGGLIVGYIIHFFAREVKGHGVPEVMEAVALEGGRMRPRIVLGRLFASGICIASGGSVGREGPIVQIGAALASTVGQWLNLDQRRLKTLVGCGAAAGIAATFNAPVGGALFAVEVILGDFGVAQFAPIVISSVAATVVSHRYLGNFPTFEVPGYSLEGGFELFAYAALGIVAGLVALLFIRSLYGLEDLFDKVRMHPPLKAAMGGVMIGVIGIWLPAVFGVSYEAINHALDGTMLWRVMLLLAVVKIVGVGITIGSGGSGGVFAPSLFIGAMVGGAIGTVVHAQWPMSTGGAGAYALVGMGALVAGTTHAPITAILIIFELTGDYEIILPLMISCIIATLLSTKLQRPSIYTLKLLRKGIDIQRGRDVNVLQPVQVREIIRPDFVAVSPDDPLDHLIAEFMSHSGNTVFVTDDEHRLHGIVTAEEIRAAMQQASSLGSLVIVEDIMATGTFPRVSADDSLADVVKFLGAYRGEVPVLEDGCLVGAIWPGDVIERYNTEVFKRDMARSMVATVDRDLGTAAMQTADNAVVADVAAPRSFVGRTIRELDIRRSFGVTVLMIKQPVDDGSERLTASPDGDYVFQPGDVLLVMGPSDKLQTLRQTP